jgi:hypothetical protein
MQAATMADIVLSQRMRRREVSLTTSALDPEHFEFRQAGSEGPSVLPVRRRVTDNVDV